MPRPKVKPQDRQRSEKACQPCKAAKVRCSGEAPCLRCSKRGKVAGCIFSATPRAKRTTTASADGLGVIPEDGQTARSTAIPSPMSTRGSISQDGLADEYPENTESRLMYSSKGEKVYVGETASLSFLQFLRVVVRQHMGPCDFTETDFKDCMLEVDAPSNDELPLNEQSLEQQDELVSAYVQATAGFLDLQSPEELSTMPKDVRVSMQKLNAPEDQQAVLYAILAVGAQARNDSFSDAIYARHYFKIAQSRAFQDMLCDPSLSMVKLFLLMAFYMFGACHRNAGFMYLGVASKAAIALGLHKSEQGLNLAADESGARCRCWKSLRVLDGVVNAVLGRPNCLPSTPSVSPFLDMSVDPALLGQTLELACQGILSMLALVDGLDLKSRKGAPREVNEAVQLLKRTRAWSETLPYQLQPGQAATAATPQTATAHLHVTCAYYFTIILVTRPFMVSSLAKRLRASSSSESMATDPTDPKVAELGQVCLDSSIYLARAAHAALSAGAMLGNMCILKAWIFAAGLLIGFALFGRTDGSEDLIQPFENAREVLDHLRRSSAQAALYHDILSSLSDAITTRKNQVLARRHSLTSQYIQPLFPGAQQDSAAADLGASENQALPQTNAPNVRDEIQPITAFGTPAASNAFLFDASLDMANMSMLWDDIEFDWASLDLELPV